MDTHTARFEFVRKHPVITFFVITYLIGYIAAIPLFFTQISALGLIAASSSSLGGIITAALYNKKEVKRLFISLIQFRCGVSSYLFALLFPPILVVGAILINMLLGHPFPALDAEKWKLIIPIFAFSLIQAGLGEEMGWRGFALPHLVKKTHPLAAAIIIGIVWACWHLPLYFFPGFIQHDVAQIYGFFVTFSIYSSFVVAASVIYSWLYLRSGNSLIPAILIHGMTNVCGWYFNYKDTHAYGGLTMLIALSLLWIVAAVLVSAISPVFRTQRGAITS